MIRGENYFIKGGNFHMDNITKAKINLFAVLRNMEDLCEMDQEAKKLIEGKKISVGFSVPEVGKAVLKFENGKCTFIPNSFKASLKLWFTSADHFNKLIDGEKTIPIFCNVFQVGFLLNVFQGLADRLSYYLQPAEDKKDELLKDPDYFRTSTILTAYTAFFAIAQVGNSDKVGKIIAKRMPDCKLLAGVKGEVEINLTIEGHKLTSAKGAIDAPVAEMVFADLEFAHRLLTGEASSFAGMGEGKFEVRGAVGILEQMSKLLDLVSMYLA